MEEEEERTPWLTAGMRSFFNGKNLVLLSLMYCNAYVKWYNHLRRIRPTSRTEEEKSDATE